MIISKLVCTLYRIKFVRCAASARHILIWHVLHRRSKSADRQDIDPVADLSKASSATDQEGLHFYGSYFHRPTSETRGRLRGGVKRT